MGEKKNITGVTVAQQMSRTLDIQVIPKNELYQIRERENRLTFDKTRDKGVSK